MTEITRNSHFVPRSYLKRFADQTGRVWVYDRRPDHPQVPNPRPVSTRRAGAEYDLYTVETAGALDDRWEHWFKRDLEDPAFPILEKLRQRQAISPVEATVLGRYITGQELRTPLARDGLNRTLMLAGRQLAQELHGEIIRRLRSGAAPGGRRWSREEIDRYERALSVGEFDIPAEGDVNYWIGEFLTRMLAVWAPRAARQEWVVLSAPTGAAFVTSDAPVVKATPHSNEGLWKVSGWDHRGVWVTFPLSSDQMLFCVTDESTAAALPALTEAQCKLLNERTAAFAHRYVYSGTRADYVMAPLQRTLSP